MLHRIQLTDGRFYTWSNDSSEDDFTNKYYIIDKQTGEKYESVIEVPENLHEYEETTEIITHIYEED